MPLVLLQSGKPRLGIFFWRKGCSSGKNDLQAIDALRKNGVRCESRVGDDHNSVYDLVVDEILRTTDTNAEFILDLSTPVIGAGDVVDIFYTLFEPTNDPLPFFGPDRQIILSVGGQEVELTASNGQANFLELDYLDLLDSSDFLTISIFLNNDSANTLWEFGFKRMDVDVDSDNNNKFELPNRDSAEEEIENDDAFSGKIIAVNDGDKNGNDVPDYVEMVGMPTQFTPMVVSLASGVDRETSTIKFEYAGSDPASITFDNEIQDYIVAPGYQRIWRKDGPANRSPNPLGSNGAGGDYIVPNREYKLNAFNIIDDEIVFYIEGIKSSIDGDSARIKTTLTTQ